MALDIPDANVIDRMVAFQGELAATGADLKLVERQNLHFTVKFLGEISEAQAKDAATKLGAVKLNSAEVTLKGVGAFPRPSRPSVIWVGLTPEDAEKVAPLATAVIRSLEGIGESDDRPFQAHITVARVKGGRNRETLESFLGANADRAFGRVKLASLKLMSSLLTPTGPVYNDLEVYRLR